MGSFERGESIWVERLGNLRNAVRQEVIGRQLAGHVEAGMSVLDVGCGQGTQALRLARRGCAVTGLDPSAALLEPATAAPPTGPELEVLAAPRRGRTEALTPTGSDQTFLTRGMS